MDPSQITFPANIPGEFRDAAAALFSGFDLKVQPKASSKKPPRRKKPDIAEAEELRSGLEEESLSGAGSALVDNIRTCCECPVCRGPLFRAMLSPCGHAICFPCLGRVSAAAQATPNADIIPYEGYEAPPTPTCPTCRAPVHRDLYVRCFALDAIVSAAHPDASKDLPDCDDSEIDEELSFCSLRAWKAAQDEQLVQQAVRALWAAVKAALPTSTALLLGGPETGDDFQARSGRLLLGNPRYVNVHDEPLPQTDTYPGISPRVMKTVLMGGDVAKEIARRLQRHSLSLEVFTSRSKRFALIRWPNIPPVFSLPSPPNATIELSGGRGARPVILAESTLFEPSLELTRDEAVSPQPVPPSTKPETMGPLALDPPASTPTAPLPRLAAKKSTAAAKKPVRGRVDAT